MVLRNAVRSMQSFQNPVLGFSGQGEGVYLEGKKKKRDAALEGLGTPEERVLDERRKKQEERLLWEQWWHGPIDKRVFPGGQEVSPI